MQIRKQVVNNMSPVGVKVKLQCLFTVTQIDAGSVPSRCASSSSRPSNKHLSLVRSVKVVRDHCSLAAPLIPAGCSGCLLSRGGFARDRVKP